MSESRRKYLLEQAERVLYEWDGLCPIEQFRQAMAFEASAFPTEINEALATLMEEGRARARQWPGDPRTYLVSEGHR